MIVGIFKSSIIFGTPAQNKPLADTTRLVSHRAVFSSCADVLQLIWGVTSSKGAVVYNLANQGWYSLIYAPVLGRSSHGNEN